MVWFLCPQGTLLKFIYSEKATKFCEIFTLLLTTVNTVKSKVKILQDFVDFSEYMNFDGLCTHNGNGKLTRTAVAGSYARAWPLAYSCHAPFFILLCPKKIA